MYGFPNPMPATCPCCGDNRLRKLGEDVTETLEFIPRQGKVIQHVHLHCCPIGGAAATRRAAVDALGPTRRSVQSTSRKPTSLSQRLMHSPVVTAIFRVRGAYAAKVY